MQDEAKWIKLKTGAWCYYENKAENGTTYGKLYNWYAVNDPRGLAPEGFHIPTYGEWEILIAYLGGNEVAGGKMKEKGTDHWEKPNTNASNSSSFTGLPGGYLHADGDFCYIGQTGCWWSSSKSDKIYAWRRAMYFDYSEVNLNESNKVYGFSVRCLKD